GLFLRSGLNFKNSDDLGIMGVVSCGFGLRLRGIGFDYAFVPYGDLGVTHRLTLSRGFGPGIFPSESKRSRTAAGRDGKLFLAVAALEPDAEVSEVVSRQITDMLESELGRTGKFRLLERTRGEYVSAEKKLFYSGLGNRERALELARKLGARGVIYGDVARVGR
ncbi:MAG TPA: CsgG/HfaB family protein, partial [Elusimicrobiales bacterium]|nr:CsgG/HfaB family protein [Elusimicrobiales bacterium]